MITQPLQVVLNIVQAIVIGLNDIGVDAAHIEKSLGDVWIDIHRQAAGLILVSNRSDSKLLIAFLSLQSDRSAWLQIGPLSKDGAHNDFALAKPFANRFWVAAE